MNPDPSLTSRRGLAAAGLIAAVPFLAHLFTNGAYGMFSDEFYYLACADHLAFGYVDHPPLSITILAGWTAVFGDSVDSIRVLPAAAGAALIFLTAVMVRDLGGGGFAQAFAALCVAINPVYLALTGFYSMNPFDLLFWSLLFLLLIRLINSGNAKLWLLFGGIAGLGLQNKIGLLVPGFALAVALPFTPHRKWIAEKHLWIGAAIASAIFLPHLLWQFINGWPTREFIANAKAFGITEMSQLEFFVMQARQTMYPLLLPVWLTGLGALLFYKPLRPYRLLGLIYVVCYFVFAIQRSKPYYLAGAFPILIAAGALAIERWIAPRVSKWVNPALFTIMAAGGVAAAPFSFPLLPVDRFLRFQEALGNKAAHNLARGELSGMYANRPCWEGFVAEVARVYETLPEEDRKRSVIVTGSYHGAGAIDYFGKKYGLPPATSYHNNYYLWGPGDTSWDVVIAVRIHRLWLDGMFGEIVEVGHAYCEYGTPPYDDLPVYVCREPKLSVTETWAGWKTFF